jgi:hypothetical protein
MRHASCHAGLPVLTQVSEGAHRSASSWAVEVESGTAPDIGGMAAEVKYKTKKLNEIHADNVVPPA